MTKYKVFITQAFKWQEEVEASNKLEALSIARKLAEEGAFTPNQENIEYGNFDTSFE